MQLPQLLLSTFLPSATFHLSAIQGWHVPVTYAYSYHNKFPFSTYGENAFLGLQNITITLLIIYFPSSTSRRSASSPINLPRAAGAAVAFAALIGGLANLPK